MLHSKFRPTTASMLKQSKSLQGAAQERGSPAQVANRSSRLSTNKSCCAGKNIWEGSLVESMDGVTLVPNDSMGDDPLVRELKSEVDAAWEEQAAKRSRKTSPEKPHSRSSQPGAALAPAKSPLIPWGCIHSILYLRVGPKAFFSSKG